MAPRAPMIRFRIGQLVARYPMLSIEELCRHTQLGDSAVREHLKGLAAAGLVKPVREHRPHLFALEPKCAYVVAVEADREYARATVCDMRLNPCGKPEVLEEPRFRIVNSPATGVNQLARLVKSALEAAPDCSPVIGVGVAMPSPISRRESSPATAHHMPGWESVNVARQLEMKLRTWARLRVIVDNDASVAALACFLHGAFQRPDAPRDLLYVRVVAGIGAGIVLEGRLVGGADGLAGEIGHFQVTRSGPLCPRCGRRGCLQTIASTSAIRASLMTTGHWRGKPTLEELLEDEHPAVEYALREAGDRLGLALSNAANLLNPSVIFLGGPLRGREPFREAVVNSMQEFALRHSRPDVLWHPEMRLSPELTGAGARAAAEFFDAHIKDVIDPKGGAE